MIKYNGAALNNITYNSTSLKRVDYNGVTVWEKLEPPTLSLSGTFMSITKAANSTSTIMYCFNSNDPTTPISWRATGGTGYNISAWITDPGNYIIKAIAVGAGSLNAQGEFIPTGVYANSEWSNSQNYTISSSKVIKFYHSSISPSAAGGVAKYEGGAWVTIPINADNTYTIPYNTKIRVTRWSDTYKPGFYPNRTGSRTVPSTDENIPTVFSPTYVPWADQTNAEKWKDAFSAYNYADGKDYYYFIYSDV